MKPRVLMIAYACNPEGSGEHWLGWGWAEQAARSFAVDLITTTNASTQVERAALALGISPHFVGVPNWQRKLTDLTRTSWLRKVWWQKKAFALAKELHARKPFELVHQTTFHTFRVPFLAAGLGVPSVWGPIAGGEHVPPGFKTYLGKARRGEAGRNFLNRLSLRVPSVSRSLRQASVLFVSNKTTLNFLPAEFRKKSRLVPANALRPQDEACQPPPPKVTSDKLKLLYVGNCVATRSLPLVFEALKESGLTDYELKIVGGGPALEDWRRRAAELELGDRVKFVGKVPYTELNAFYYEADALVFPALRDSGGSALLEAMARHLPVVCLDWGGPGEMVDTNSGAKIPVSDPKQTIKYFAAALVRMKNEPGWRESLAAAGRARALEAFGWQAKRKLLEETYRGLIGRQP
jgi:glycosyltransferase involved in cell wall biosynthesis